MNVCVKTEKIITKMGVHLELENDEEVDAFRMVLSLAEQGTHRERIQDDNVGKLLEELRRQIDDKRK